MQKKKGQSILEYVIVLTVIVVAIMVAANTFVKKSVTDGLEDASQSITDATKRLPGADTVTKKVPGR